MHVWKYDTEYQTLPFSYSRSWVAEYPIILQTERDSLNSISCNKVFILYH